MAPVDREHPRYAHEAAVTFRVKGKAYEGRTQNVSRGGLCANISEAIAGGIDVELSMVLVFDDDLQSEALVLPARVAWCTTVDDAYQVGIAFRALDSKKVEYLNLFLRYLDDRRIEKRPRDLPIDDRFR